METNMTRSKPTDAGPKTPDPDPIDKAEGEEGSLPFKPKDEEEGPDEAAASGAAKKAGKKGKEKTAEPEPMPGLIEGRMVHYCLPDGKRRGEHRAATISYVHDHGSGLVNLHVLLNGAM